MGKLFGLRVNLDEIEMLTNKTGVTAVTQAADTLIIHIETTDDAAADEALQLSILTQLKERFTVPPTSYRCRLVPKIPRTERGKVDYPALEAQA